MKPPNITKRRPGGKNVMAKSFNRKRGKVGVGKSRGKA